MPGPGSGLVRIINQRDHGSIAPSPRPLPSVVRQAPDCIRPTGPPAARRRDGKRGSHLLIMPRPGHGGTLQPASGVHAVTCPGAQHGYWWQHEWNKPPDRPIGYAKPGMIGQWRRKYDRCEDGARRRFAFSWSGVNRCSDLQFLIQNYQKTPYGLSATPSKAMASAAAATTREVPSGWTELSHRYVLPPAPSLKIAGLGAKGALTC